MTLSRAEKLDKIFGTPLFAVLLAIFCNVLWGCAFPFIKMGYRLFEIDPSNTASIFCFAGVRFMLGSLLVLLGSTLLQSRMPTFPKGKVFAECCVLGLWQTTTQYAFYYIAVAMLTGAFGGILNSTQSFLGVIFAHFIYGNADRMTPAKTLGCAVGFAGVLIGTLGNHGGGSGWGIFCMLLATVIFTLSGPWNKSVTKKADSFAVCFLNLFVGGAALFVLGTALGGRLGSVTPLGILETGAPVLAGSAKILFGNLGAAILAVIVLLACLSTSVGLVTCCAAYFMRLLGHFSYKTYAVIFCVISYLVGLFGLKTIIVSTIPVLMFIYPLLVALICLIFLDKFFGGRQCVYAWTIAFTFVMATINLLETAGVNLGSFETMLQTYVPLHTFGMGWIPFAAAGFVIGLIWKAAVPEKKAAA